MQDGLVVIPNLITFDYNLSDSDEFKEMEAMRENAKSEEDREKLEENYQEMLSIIKNSEKQGMNNIVKEAIENNGKRKNGKYIIFLPMNSHDVSTERYIAEQMRIVKEYFSEIDPNPEMSFLYSDRKDGRSNDDILEEFEEDSDHLKLIFSLNMLNEGVHVEGLDGIMMLRPISSNSKILYSQQIGRVIHAISKTEDVESNESPLIFDVYNNYLAHNMDREVNKSNTTSDLQKMRYIVSWIKKHGGYFPSIDSPEESEYRKAAALRRISLKYGRYLDNPVNSNVSRTEAFEIEELINLGKELNLWDREIGERTVDDDHEEFEDIRVNTFRVKGEQKRFIDLYKDAKKKTKTVSKINIGTIRIRNVISVLELLSEYGFEINNDTITEGTTLESILRKLPNDVSKIIREELELSTDINLYNEYLFAKTMLYQKHRAFGDYSIKQLRMCGLFHPFKDEDGKEKNTVDERGFIVHAASNLLHYHIITGTLYDERGYDFNGVDPSLFKEGFEYNEHGFNKKGKHILTKTFLNERGFDIRGNYYEKSEDGLYINKGKYDRNGFDIDHLWHAQIVDPSTGKVSYDPNGTELDADGYNYLGLNEYSFDKDGYYCKVTYTTRKSYDFSMKFPQVTNTGMFETERGFTKDGLHKNGTKYDDYGFDIFGYYLDKTLYNKYGFDCNHKYYGKTVTDKRGFDFFGYHNFTHEKYDIQFFDRDGYYYVLSNGEYIKTDDKLNEYHFDCEGYYWDRDSKGNLVKSDSKVNERGFNILKINETTRLQYDTNNFDIDGYYWAKQSNGKIEKTDRRLNPRNFDCDGYYWEKDENGILVNTYQKINPRGFGIDNININTGEYWDETGLGDDGTYSMIEKKNYFGRDGYYWTQQPDGTYKKTDSLYSDAGKDANGLINPEYIPVPGADWDEHGRDKRRVFRTIKEADQFDREGNYWEHVGKEKGYRNTHKKHDLRGFDARKLHVVTGELWDEQGLDIKGKYSTIQKQRGFDSTHHYWQLQSDGTYKKTDRIYDDFGFDYRRIHAETGELWDEQGLDVNRKYTTIEKHRKFDSQGYFWEQQINGTYRKTQYKHNKHGSDKNGNKVNEFVIVEGADWDKNGLDRAKSTNTIEKAKYFDKEGNYWELQEDGTYKNTGRKINNRNFKRVVTKSSGVTFINEDTGTNFDKDGYDIDGIHSETGTKYNEYGFDVNHLSENGTEYNKYGFKYDHVHKNGTSYDDNGFDINGINKYTGYDYDKDLLDRDRNSVVSKYESRGYKLVDGIFIRLGGFDPNGYYFDVIDGKAIPTNRKTNNKGFYQDGLNERTNSLLDEYFFDINGLFYPSNRYVGNDKGLLYDTKFFDCDGYYYKEQEDGTRVKTNNKFNEDGFDRDGYYWEQQEDGTYVKTNSRYNAEGIDFYGFDKDGIHKTGNPYDENYFNSKGIHVIYNSKTDENGFDRDGRRPNKDYVNGAGFYQNGINYETGTKYSVHGTDIYHINEDRDNEPQFIQVIYDYLESRISKREAYNSLTKDFNDENEKRDKFTRYVYIASKMNPKIKDAIKVRIKKLTTLSFKYRLRIEKEELSKEELNRLKKQIEIIKRDSLFLKSFK